MKWTTPTDIVGQLRRLWEQGAVLASLARGEEIFPRRLLLKRPTTVEMAEHFAEVRAWISRLEGEAKYYRVVRQEIRHRTLGANTVPAEVWVDSLADCLALLGKHREAERFADMVALTGQRFPQLVAWLGKRSLRGLELAENWPRLLDIVAWLQAHPRPGIYLRQVDIAGVHSKFIENHRGVLSELFDLVLDRETITESIKGAGSFCRRYGFRDKPARIRFRLLDPALALLISSVDQDFTVTAETFAGLNLPVQRVYITENEINFLAFPPVAASMVIFGAGYGFNLFADVPWLYSCALHYWGDIDTHGFAILDQLRALFPAANSFLMDRETLFAHQLHWGLEPQPSRAELSRLTVLERLLYDDLRLDRLAIGLRLEQERIRFAWVEKTVCRGMDAL